MIASPLFKKPSTPAAQPGYNRPGDWLALPDMSATEGVAGLYAVGNHNSNFVAFTVAGAFDVDWGDGTTDSYASGATAEHNFDWADLSTTTLTSRGFRQAIIQITPQSGASITSLNFNISHSTPGSFFSRWLDIELNAPNCGSINVFNGFHRYLEQVKFHAWGGTNFTRMFRSCVSLQNIEFFENFAPSGVFEMFYGCSSLKSVSLDTSNATSFQFMFYGCSSLQSVSLDTSSGTNFSAVFQGCASLAELPALNMSSGTNLSSAFSALTSLARVQATGMKVSFSVANCSLSSAALDEIYGNLATVTGQTITVTGNYGTASDNPSIATAKGWTVTG